MQTCLFGILNIGTQNKPLDMYMILMRHLHEVNSHLSYLLVFLNHKSIHLLFLWGLSVIFGQKSTRQVIFFYGKSFSNQVNLKWFVRASEFCIAWMLNTNYCFQLTKLDDWRRGGGSKVRQHPPSSLRK